MNFVSGDGDEVANYLDHLLAIDEYVRTSPAGCVTSGFEMHNIARAAGLATDGNPIAANWTGQLIELEYLVHGPKSLGDPRPLLPGRMWSDADLQRFNDYRVTSKGREEADRVRRQRRERRTDAALGLAPPGLTPAWMRVDQRRAVAAPLKSLRAALDSNDNAAAIGAAKDLVEAACKIRIENCGGTFSRTDSLPTLCKAACQTNGSQGSGAELARSLTATVQRLAELRNIAGAGHGRSSVPKLGSSEAYLAAAAATAIANFLLS